MTSSKFICESQGNDDIYCTICRLFINTVRSTSCHFDKMTTFKCSSKYINVTTQNLFENHKVLVASTVNFCRLSTTTVRSTSCHPDI